MRPEVLVDLGEVEELRHKGVVDGVLSVGAMCCHRDIWADPLIRRHWSALADAAAGVGDRRSRIAARWAEISLSARSSPT